MALDQAFLDALTPRATPYKVTEGKGLYLLIQPNGGRYWRFRYRRSGKQNTLSCGVFPIVSLVEARARRDEFRSLLKQGIDPSEHRKAERIDQLNENSRLEVATRFLLDSDGALYVRLGARRFSLTPAETHTLRIFLDATRTVIAGGTTCP
jgi:hypothetical protein